MARAHATTRGTLTSMPAPLFRDERVSFYGLDNLFIAVWDDAPEEEQMLALGKYGRAFETAHGPCALLNVAASGSPRFSDEVRRIATDYTRDGTLFQSGRAHVILMTGFAGVAVRAFINTFLLLGNPPVPTRMFSSLDAAADWLGPLVRHTPWTAAAIVDVMGPLLPSNDA